MFKTERTTLRIDLDDPEDLKEYDAIQNDPNCTIIREFKEKLSDKEFEEGKLVSLHERIVLVITYEERKLM